jgi:hypothetical protein
LHQAFAGFCSLADAAFERGLGADLNDLATADVALDFFGERIRLHGDCESACEQRHPAVDHCEASSRTIRAKIMRGTACALQDGRC